MALKVTVPANKEAVEKYELRKKIKELEKRLQLVEKKLQGKVVE